MQRPRREVRSHPFDCSASGVLPRPKPRLHLSKPHASPVCADTLPVSCASLPTLPCVPSSIALREVDCSVGSGSLKELECAERRKWATIWLGFARAVAENSELKLSLSGASDAALLPLFLDRAPSTLQRHIGGWRIWLGFCASQGLSAGAPSMAHVLDFTVSLVEGCKADRGQGRRRSAVSCLSAMSFAAFKCQLRALSECLASPLIKAWREHGKWALPPVKEATPLPLQIVRGLEQALLDSTESDQFLIAAILFMVWGGLRFSDAQRVDLRSIVCDKHTVRGKCWRTKSSPRGMYWGFFRRGCLNRESFSS